LSWLQPAFAAPVFATLLLVVGYQNLVTFRRCGLQPASRGFFPGLRCAGPRGEARWTIAADYRHGVALPVVLPPQPSPGAYASYSFELYDPQGKLAWTGLAAPPDDEASDLAGLSLVIPGAMLRNGAYTLAVSGIAAHGNAPKSTNTSSIFI